MFNFLNYFAYSRLIRLADRARDNKNWEYAADLYSEAVKLRPYKSDIFVQIGNVSKEAKQFSRSKQSYMTAIRIDPNNADAHLQLGHLFKVMGDLKAAERSYLRGQELDPTNENIAAELHSATIANDVVPQPRKARISKRPVSFDARIVGVRSELDQLVKLGAVTHRPDRDAAALDRAKPALIEAVKALNTVLARTAMPATLSSTMNDGSESAANETEIVFDVSDLIQYFRNHRLPTGIQRVQIEVISIAIIYPSGRGRVRVCCFTESTDFWREVPPADFLSLCELSSIDNDWRSPEWQDAMLSLEETMEASSNFQFATGALLINIGTSWWLQNYYLYVREAKRRSQIRYIPFVHDMIPILTPEYCVEGLVQDFIGWAQGVYRHADFFFVNSESTRRDLRRVGAALGYQLSDDVIHTVTLDADYRKTDVLETDPEALAAHRLEPGRFVLFVSTIEARKNHLTIFDAWLTLIKEYGPDLIPRLVCVGSRGWLNDAVFAKLGNSQLLRDKVLIMSGVPDPELAQLYRHCLFSVYPSFYEGWGLPVTESLSYGKTAVVARSSSLMEAGGEFVDYFTPGNQAEVTTSLSRLIFDPAYREARELKIRQQFRPRSWDTVANDLIGAAYRWQSTTGIVSDLDTPIEIGRYYTLSRNAETSVFSGMGTGEVFRVGDRWWGPDDRGCWLKPGPGQLRLNVETAGQYCLYLGLRALPSKDTPYDVTVLGYPIKRGEIRAAQTKWLTFTLRTDQPRQTLKIIIEGYALEYLKPRTDQEANPIALSVIGLMLCRADDGPTRSRFMEAISLDSLKDLARGDRPAATFLV